MFPLRIAPAFQESVLLEDGSPVPPANRSPRGLSEIFRTDCVQSGNSDYANGALPPTRHVRVESGYKDFVVDQRQRAARLEFVLLLACRLVLLVGVVVWLDSLLGRVVAFMLLALTRALAG